MERAKKTANTTKEEDHAQGSVVNGAAPNDGNLGASMECCMSGLVRHCSGIVVVNHGLLLRLVKQSYCNWVCGGPSTGLVNRLGDPVIP